MSAISTQDATATHHDETVLVCTTGPDAAPKVVLADGSYDTDGERVYWRKAPEAEVLRVPLGTKVVIRSVRHFRQARPSQEGEQRLLEALAPHLSVPAQRAGSWGADSLQVRLSTLLAAGEVAAAEATAAQLWRRESLNATHTAISACLAAEARGEGTQGVLQQRAAATTARSVLERLRALTPEASATKDGGRRVVLAVPPADPHTLALTALAHQLEQAGHAVLVVEDAPVSELASLVARERPLAVVISAHLPWSSAAARPFLGALRAANPDTLLVVGGPGAPASLPRADLLTDDPLALLNALQTRAGALTPREREVLLAVAEGRTTNEIAQDLGLSPATVRTHLDHVFAKTGTEHRAAAVARALRQGWIS